MDLIWQLILSSDDFSLNSTSTSRSLHTCSGYDFGCDKGKLQYLKENSTRRMKKNKVGGGEGFPFCKDGKFHSFFTCPPVAKKWCQFCRYKAKEKGEKNCGIKYLDVKQCLCAMLISVITVFMNFMESILIATDKYFKMNIYSPLVLYYYYNNFFPLLFFISLYH